MKVLVKVALDLDDAHQRIAYETLMATREEAMKDLIVGAILYYTKAPSYLAELRMKEYLERVEALRSVFEDPNLQALSAQVGAITSAKDEIVAGVVSAIEGKLDGIDLSSARPRGKGKKAAMVDMPDDVLDSMTDAFTTE